MAKDIILFNKEELTFKHKFYRLMDILILKQAESREESVLLMTIFYLQILASFFSDQVGVFSSENGKSDSILNSLEKIVRLKGLFENSYNYLLIFRALVFILMIIEILHFLLSCYKMSRNSFYSYNKIVINYYLKIFLYILYNIIYDISFSSFCLGSAENNPNFPSVKCSSQAGILHILISLILIVVSLCIYIFINIYYNDSFYLSNSYFAKMSCNYDIYWGFNCMIISLLLTQAKFLSKEIFLIYNLVISIILFAYFINHYLFYDKYINTYTGIFHILYAWTSIYSIIFAYLDFKEKGIIYILTSIIVCFFYFNIKNRIESKIFLDTPFYKIENKYYLLYYFRSLIDIINNVEENAEDKSFLSGIIRMHEVECPNPNCLTKVKKNIYLPLTNKWSDPTRKEIEDEVFLKNFIVIVMNYFLFTHECSVDMYLNLSLYYLKVIGNYCQAIYYYKKATELKLSLREEYSFIRLSIQISKALVEKLKPSNEQCSELENLDVSMYYKYDSLSQSFLDEINNDANLSLEFWKAFRAPLREANKKIDFNKIFELTDKIGKTKKNVENMWNKLLQIYGGVNDFFELYVEYVEQINDDDLKKRDLESLRRKNDSFGEHMSNNFYSVLFNKDTGIIIANGDKGSEGVIELSNKEIENIFRYKAFDLKGMNLTTLMPRLFAKDHSRYVEEYFKVGEKKLIDKNDFKSFGKDKNNSVIKIKLAIKLFPVLNDKVYFVGLILKENIDDIILLDDKFNIQGMSLKLMKILNINNKNLFQENEIPFYVICRKFVNFHSIFLQGKKKGDISEKQVFVIEEEGSNGKDEENKNENKKNEKEDIHENIEINENVELEYEIKLPQFLIDYSEKTNKKEGKAAMQLISAPTESEDQNEVIEEYDENDLLMEEEKKNDKNSGKNFNTPAPTPTPGGETTPGAVPISESAEDDSDITNGEQKVGFNKQSEEEKFYNSKIEQYKSLFNEGKVNDLEELIDNCNKNSASVEYKFNFTFDKYRYGNKQISYIVRCIDNKNDIGKSQEESAVDLDPKAAKYKKEKAESIKPLFEILEEEKNEIIALPEQFLKLSLENKKFQKLLQICKNDINTMSKAHGQKKEEVLEDENSSQSSQTGFDSGLVKKNRIEEIRSNLLTNISSFYTLKYIRIVMSLIGLFSIAFSLIYILFFTSLYGNLKNTSALNINLFQTTLWTAELISLYISLRTLYIKDVISNINETWYNYPKFTFNDYLNNNTLYYQKCIDFSLILYDKLSNAYGNIEMDVPKYLSEDQLMDIYWNRVTISYMNEEYIKYSGKIDDESFPMAMNQLLSNAITYFESTTYNNLNSLSTFSSNNESNKMYFDYMTHLIIENGYENILPNQYQKLRILPNILSKANSKKTTSIISLVCIFGVMIIILCTLYFFLIHLTNKSMTDGMEKVTKIRLEKIEEIIKRIKIFNSNLKKFREKDSKSDDNKDNMDMQDDENKNQEGSKIDSNGDRNKKKMEQESSLVGSNGFNTDFKKYIPLTILNYSFLYSIFILVIIIASLIPIYMYSLKMVKNTNQLLLVQNYIYGKLISTSVSMIKSKYFMSSNYENNLTNTIDYETLVDMDQIQEVIKGVNIFPKISIFYNEKFLLNACAAAINAENDTEAYNECLEDTLIVSANNTDNLLKLIDDLVDSIEKEQDMNQDDTRHLFNTSYFHQIEYMFYNYIFTVGDNFATVVTNDLNDYLYNKNILIILICVFLGVITAFYCLIIGVILTKRLVHHLSVSRCIMKIIPTSVIISTQELEAWIENKY